MSLWTPGGEHVVPRSDPTDAPAGAPSTPGTPREPAGAPAAGPTELDPEARSRAEEVAQEMSEVREQLASAPAAMVVANHAMGLYELAAIHLSRTPPNFGEAKIAIDAFAALVDTVADRLGADGATLRDALAQIRLAYVQLQAGDRSEGANAEGSSAEPDR